MKAILLSLPWAYYNSPSISIGSLAAYAQKRGFDVAALHLHLEIAALFGLYNYSTIPYGKPTCGDAMCASLLFPDRKKTILRYLGKEISNAEELTHRLHKVLRDVYKKIQWSRYDLVGFTINYEQLFISLLIAKWIKRDHPDIRIVFGGRCVASDIGESVLRNFDQVDWCVDGEGEIAFTELLRAIRNKRTEFESDIPGLIYRRIDSVVRNERQELPNLIGMPDPDFDHFFSLIDNHPKLQGKDLSLYLPIEESRGCNFRCRFCSDFRFIQSRRVRPPLELYESINRLCKRYRVNAFVLLNLMISPGSCRELFPLFLKNKHNHIIFCEIRAGLSKNKLKVMKDGGLIEVQSGIEAIDTSLLNKMNKGTRLIDNLQTMKHCEELGIRNGYNLILGFPSESQQEIKRSVMAIDYALGFGPPARLVSFRLLESSDVELNPKKYSIYRIDKAGIFAKLLPKHISKDFSHWYKEFKSKKKPRDYRGLKKRVEEWRKSYEKGIHSGRPILYYMDCRDFLRIEDFRKGEKSITLEGWAREVYLFCDSIKSFDEIKNRFPDVSEKNLKRTLNKLFKLKVMFKEGDDWLSLAIHASPENRRHMPFL